MDRTWEVLLIGGASGSGKTSVSYRIAQHFGVGITEVDDFQVLLEAMTTPEQQPLLHYWNTHPDAIYLPPERIMEHLIGIGEMMTPGLRAVINNHLESRQPIVLEGDFILPSLVTGFDHRVRALFIDEDDEAQFVENYRLREPEDGDQSGRARVSWLYSRWLKQEAQKFGHLIIPARPWDTIFDRIVEAL